MKKSVFAFLVSAIMIICVSLSVCAENGSAPTSPGISGDSSSGGAASVYTNTVYTDGVYKVSANVPEGSVIIFACYEDEALAFVDFVTYTAENADSIQFEVSEEIAYDSAKVFVWDGFSGMNAVKTPEIVNVTKITPLTELAVIDSVAMGVNCDIICAYTSEDNEPQFFYVDVDTTVPVMYNGDVAVLSFGSDGEVIEAKKLYTPDNSDAATEAMFAAEKTYDEWGTGISEHYLKTGIEAFDSTYYGDDHWARVGFGIITDKGNSWIEVMKVRGATVEEAAIQDAGIEIGDPVSNSSTDVISLLVDSNVNVYVYDYNKKGERRTSKGSMAHLTRTFVPAIYIAEKGGDDIYNWKMVLRKNYVFYKITDDEVTDILIIYPAV